MRTLIIDNYDSFTYNLVDLVGACTGEEPSVVRNDERSWADLEAEGFDRIILSPGPGHPANRSDFGVCLDAVVSARVPVLGVCLGHQGIAHAFGATIEHAPEPMHGRISRILHGDGDVLFNGVPKEFEAVRYHSLIVREPLPPVLKPLAWTSDGLLMALRHVSRPIWGVQFHPESVCSRFGLQILRNFLRSARQAAVGPRKLSVPAFPGGELRSSRLPLRVSTPALFAGLFAKDQNAFWLDSSQVTATSRFSFMGAVCPGEGRVVRYDSASKTITENAGAVAASFSGDLFRYLRDSLRSEGLVSSSLPFPFAGGYIGYFGYELKRDCGGVGKHRSAFPDATLLFVDRFVAVDHQTDSVYVVARSGRDDVEEWIAAMATRIEDLREPDSIGTLPACEPDFTPSLTEREYIERIARCQRHLADGESYEICLTNTFTSRTCADPLLWYLTLRKNNPAPYSAFLRVDTLSVACSSPECFLRVDETGRVISSPIKGTAGRSQDPVEDERLRSSLRNDEKSRAENLMIVDLVRNDLRRVCESGSVEVTELMCVKSYATVHQLVSTIEGQLRPEYSPVDCLHAAFPPGSMTGAPKLRTMEILDELEPQARGIYSGSIGYLSLNGSADLNVVIRSAVFHEGSVTVGSGGAIVVQSDPPAEWNEILLKAGVLLDTFGSRSVPSEDTARTPA